MGLALVSIGKQHGKVLNIGDKIRCGLCWVEYIDSVHYLFLSLSSYQCCGGNSGQDLAR